MKLSPIYLVTKTVLMCRKECRDVANRKKVVEAVQAILPHASYESVTRSCRIVQNTEKNYTFDDNRHHLEQKYRSFFKEKVI